MPRRLPEQPFAVEAHTQLQPRYDAGAWPVTTQGVTSKGSRTSCGCRQYNYLFALLEHLTLEMLAYGRQKPAFSHFVARIFKKILTEQLAHFIR